MHLLRPVLAVTLAAGATLSGMPASAAAVSYASCAEVIAAGKAPLKAGEPGYSLKLDRDGDGTACETGGTPTTKATTTATSTTTATRTSTPTATGTTTTTSKPPTTTTATATKPVTGTATGTATAPGTATGTATATGTTTTPKGTTTTPTRPEHRGVGSGLYQVRRDLRPGLYRTAGDGPNFCSWYRLRANDGEFDSIIAVDLFRGPGSVTVRAGDRFVKFSGGCAWRRDGGGDDHDSDGRNGRDGRDSDHHDSGGRGGGGRDDSDSDDGDGDGDGSSSSASSSGSRPGVYTQVAASAVPVGGIETGS